TIMAARSQCNDSRLFIVDTIPPPDVLNLNDEDDSKKIDLVITKFEEYCIPRQNVTYERFRLFTRDQGPTETVDQYMMELQKALDITQQHDGSKADVPKSDKAVIKDCKYCGRDHEKLKCQAKNDVPNGDVQFLMDTGAESNGFEQPIEGRAMVRVSRDLDMIDMDMIKILDSDQKPRVSVVTAGCDPLLQEFNDVFEGLGKLEGQYTIVTDPSVKPVVHPPRRLPVALIDQVQEKLDNMVKDDIIAKVDQPTDWVSSMLAVRKPTLGPDGKVDIRICLDPKDLNGAIKREHFPMPTIEEVATRLNRAKIFSVFDASNGFWQVELDPASSRFTTFNTPFGRYCWKRMPFGISSAPEVWQRKMHEHVEGLHGVEVIADDFVVVGFGSTPEEWNADHDRNVRAFLERCREKNLKLKKEKAQLRKTEVAFIGHILTPDGLKPDPKKVEAINDMPHPTDVQSLRRFLGMVTYLAKFLPCLSDETEVLRKLTEKDAEWCWLTAHEEAVVRIQRMISTVPVLAYYDVTKPVTIQCDASQTGLGAALLQDGHPIAYSSRALTATERNYAQIEKELLAIVYACEKFDQYIFGKSDVVVESDHKPLETIFRKPIHSAPKRLQRMRLRLQSYDIRVEYKKGTMMYLADTLMKEQVFSAELEQLKHDEDLNVLPRKLKRLREETSRDEELKILIHFITHGWPDNRKEASKLDNPSKRVFHLYWNSRDELTYEDGIVYKGHRVVIPAAERQNTMKSLHQSHIGIEGTLRRARDTVYWPGITAVLKDYISKCGICNRYRPEQCKEPLHPHKAPEIPWEKVGVDLFELDGQTFLIAVDYYSGLFEVQDMTSTVASRVITVLKSWFARHGIPITVMSDNGPPFNSESFKDFSDEWDFNHITSSPHHPQSNGKVENAVKTCKSLLKKARDDKQAPLLSILEWRNTPTEGMGASPAQLLYGRRTRTRLPVAKKQLKPTLIEGVTKKMEKGKEKQKKYFDRQSRKLKRLSAGDVIRMRCPGDSRWSLGKVIEVMGFRSYLVEVNGRRYRRNRRHLHEPLTDDESINEPPELFMILIKKLEYYGIRDDTNGLSIQNTFGAFKDIFCTEEQPLRYLVSSLSLRYQQSMDT
ncbi:Transposon Ty3-G Gag-Pol poly, partial [Paramuricea clavata]